MKTIPYNKQLGRWKNVDFLDGGPRPRSFAKTWFCEWTCLDDTSMIFYDILRIVKILSVIFWNKQRVTTNLKKYKIIWGKPGNSDEFSGSASHLGNQKLCNVACNLSSKTDPSTIIPWNIWNPLAAWETKDDFGHCTPKYSSLSTKSQLGHGYIATNWLFWVKSVGYEIRTVNSKSKLHSPCSQT